MLDNDLDAAAVLPTLLLLLLLLAALAQLVAAALLVTHGVPVLSHATEPCSALSGRPARLANRRDTAVTIIREAVGAEHAIAANGCRRRV